MANGVTGVAAGAMAGLLFLAAPAHATNPVPKERAAPAAEPAEPAEPAPAPNTALIQNVTVFNDEIVEPVSLPVTNCQSLIPVLSKSSTNCKGASRVSDDDA
ncbi:hypothetical protein [Sinosporangium siamense]|uniref:hypothetical protein n=1 Tax=Sinosporangium siamense TaxID=1367973 RepID=UPI00194DDC05|nr:hypothetical protein [Sinosporangium siamense]